MNNKYLIQKIVFTTSALLFIATLAIVAITKKGHNSHIKKEFSSLEGNIIISNINNKKAEVHEV